MSSPFGEIIFSYLKYFELKTPSFELILEGRIR